MPTAQPNSLTPKPSRTRPVVCVALVALPVLAALALPGCVKPLFPRNEPRSQFESYDIVRNQNQPLYVFDEFGRQQPNLRGRLSPKR